MSVEAVREQSTPGTELGARDASVRHGWQSRQDIYPYLDVVTQQRIDDWGIGASLRRGSDRGLRGYREDALPDGKVPVGPAVASPSVELTRTQLLDGCGIEWALLIGGPVSMVTAHPDLDFGSTLARAFNQFSVEHWLAADPRFRLALSINARDPAGAAAEIARLGDDSRVVAVTAGTGTMMPYGQRYYAPLHEACAERGLVFAIHSGYEGQGVNPPPTAAGYPSYWAEDATARASLFQAHVTSLVFEGVFERFPSLRVLLLDGGFAWVQAYLWYIDQTWEDVRRQTPWVRRPPSEYVLEHVRFTTRPLEQGMLDGPVDDILDWMGASETLVFGSGYPAWDWSDPRSTLAGADAPLRERVMAGNASGLFRS